MLVLGLVLFREAPAWASWSRGDAALVPPGPQIEPVAVSAWLAELSEDEVPDDVEEAEELPAPNGPPEDELTDPLPCRRVPPYEHVTPLSKHFSHPSGSILHRNCIYRQHKDCVFTCEYCVRWRKLAGHQHTFFILHLVHAACFFTPLTLSFAGRDDWITYSISPMAPLWAFSV